MHKGITLIGNKSKEPKHELLRLLIRYDTETNAVFPIKGNQLGMKTHPEG